MGCEGEHPPRGLDSKGARGPTIRFDSGDPHTAETSADVSWTVIESQLRPRGFDRLHGSE